MRRRLSYILFAGIGAAALLHTNKYCGQKSRASVREFHRASYNQPPSDWKGPIFKPKLDFSTARCQTDSDAPWEQIDFKTDPAKYMSTVLEYCFEGNLENDFVPQKNGKRQWYHAPWMCQTPKGREPIHGLTFEKPARQGYLAETQKRVCQTWAVAMYNELGAYTFHQVWKKVYKPRFMPIKFPNGTISFKLLFTEATPDDVPFLKGSPQWKATIAEEPHPVPSKERTSPRDLHLVQIDFAVRDARADNTTGWVFGTFMYHNSVEEDDPWKRLIPVSLIYGNDPTLTPKGYEEGERPKESWVNPDANATLPPTRPYFGWLGRGNGPADTFKSSCISCHSTANYPEIHGTPEKGSLLDQTMLWFRNIKAGEPFGSVGYPLDYSLQMTVGLKNYVKWSQKWHPVAGCATPSHSHKQLDKHLPTYPQKKVDMKEK